MAARRLRLRLRRSDGVYRWFQDRGFPLRDSDGEIVRWCVLFAFALTTGMRPEEYLGLQWKDVDLERGTVTVRRALVWREKGGWYFGEPKTARSRRAIPLPASTVRALSEHRRGQNEERLKLGPDYQHHICVRANWPGRTSKLLLFKSRPYRIDHGDCERSGIEKHHLQRDCARVYRDRHDVGVDRRLQTGCA